MRLSLFLLLLVSLAAIVCVPPAEEIAVVDATAQGEVAKKALENLVGRNVPRAAAQSDLEENSVLECGSAIEEIRLAGDWAVVRGTFDEIFTPKGGGDEVHVTGKWMEIDEKQSDGSWKITHSIWNRDAQLPVGAEE